jgi:hypothetical protein
MRTFSPLHPVRAFQISETTKRDYDEHRKNFGAELTLKRKDGAEALITAQKITMPMFRGMGFDDLQKVVYSRFRAFQETDFFVRFWDGPRQIFNFDSELVGMLTKTEVGDVPWDSLRFPYQEFYIHFGCALESQIESNRRLYKAEGAYVLVQPGPSFVEGFNPGALHVQISTRLVHPSYEEVLGGMQRGFSLKEPVYRMTVSGEAGETVTQALARGRAANLEMCRKLDGDILASSKGVAAQYGIDSGKLASANSLGLEERRFLRGELLTAEALPLVFNCIAYLTAIPEQREAVYPAEAPKSLVERIEKAPTPKKKAILTKNMDHLGFTKLVFVKDPAPTAIAVPAETGKTVRTHWRRGHWRSQAFGSGMIKRVLIWIRPCVVNAEKAEDGQVPGHIYKVPDAPEEAGANVSLP